MKQFEWLQTQWTRAGRGNARKDGDFYTAAGLYPTPNRQQLRRAPSRSAFTAWSQSFTRPMGAFFDTAGYGTPKYAFVGRAAGDVQTIYYDDGGQDANVAYSAIYDHNLAQSIPLRGKWKRNCLIYYANHIYFISDADQDVYKCASRGNATLLFDGAANDAAQHLFLHGDRLYCVTATGQVWELDAAGAGFDQLWDPQAYMEVQYAHPTAHYLTLFVVFQNGQLQLLRLPFTAPQEALPVVTLEGIPGDFPIVPSTQQPFMGFASDGDDLFFLSGHIPPLDAASLDLYRYDGTRIDKVAELTGLGDVATKHYARG